MAGRNYYRYAAGRGAAGASTSLYHNVGFDRFSAPDTYNNNVDGSLRCKFNANDLLNAPRLFAKDGGSMRFYPENSGKLSFKLGSQTVGTANGLVTTGTTYSARVDWTNSGGGGGFGEIWIYLDGAEVLNIDRTVANAASDNLFIGGYDSGSNFMDGEIWECERWAGGARVNYWPLTNEDLTDNDGSNDLVLITGATPGSWQVPSYTV